MNLTGEQALNRSQLSAESEVGSIDCPTGHCPLWIGVKATYDDLWSTPVTDRKVRIEANRGLLADGARTRSLPRFGMEDGQPHEEVRSDLGTYLHGGVTIDATADVSIEIVPDDTAPVDGIVKAIYDQLTSFETTMRAWLQPWINQWSTQGWLSIPNARFIGQLRGVSSWWEGEVDFWKGVSGVASDVWDGIKGGFAKVANWYSSLPWYEKILPVLALGREAGEAIVEGAQSLWAGANELWEKRDKLMNAVKAFLNGTADAIETALEALMDLPGELGKLFKDLVKNSAEWVQNMIEVAREYPHIYVRTITTLVTVVMLMTPNFWAEGIGLVEGYLLPEVLITIVLAIIGALCVAAGASALAGRIAGMLSKLRKFIQGAGKVGELFVVFFKKLDDIVELIGKLSKALRRKIAESGTGAVNKLKQLVRPAAKQSANVGKEVKFTKKQLQKKFKHAKKFGVEGNYSPTNADTFRSALERHVASTDTRSIHGTYNGSPVTHHYNQSTGLNVMTDTDGNFISGWQLSSQQAQHLVRDGAIGGH